MLKNVVLQNLEVFYLRDKCICWRSPRQERNDFWNSLHELHRNMWRGPHSVPLKNYATVSTPITLFQATSSATWIVSVPCNCFHSFYAGSFQSIFYAAGRVTIWNKGHTAPMLKTFRRPSIALEGKFVVFAPVCWALRDPGPRHHRSLRVLHRSPQLISTSRPLRCPPPSAPAWKTLSCDVHVFWEAFPGLLIQIPLCCYSVTSDPHLVFPKAFHTSADPTAY